MLPLAGWSFCKPMTVRLTYLDEDLSGYPSIVRIIADTDIGAVCLASGYDIRFTALDGTTLLNYERVSFSVTGGAATGIFWAKVDHTISPATQIYCHYGNAAAPDVSNPALTWTAYTRRWSLREEYSTAAGNYKDSLGVGHLTLTDADGDSGRAAGPVDFAVDLAGDADFLTDADHADHDPGGAMTVEVWVNQVSFQAWGRIIGHDASSSKYRIYTHNNTGKFGASLVTVSGEAYASETTFTSTSGAWAYVVFSYNRTWTPPRLKMYCQGFLDANASQTTGYDEDITAGDEGITIGKVDTPFFDGLIAEVRYSKDAKSAAWIKFTNFSIRSADGEWDWGAEEAAPPAGQPGIYNSDLWSGGYPLFKGDNL